MGRTEKILLSVVTVILSVFSICAVFLLWNWQGEPFLARSRVDKTSGSLLESLKSQDDALGEMHSLCLSLPGHHSERDITIDEENEYLSYRITINRVSASYFADYPVTGSGEHILSLDYRMQKGSAILTLRTKRPFFIRRINHGDEVFVDLIDPLKYFDRIVVVDASHGGSDTGAVSDGVKEKDITLSIIKKFKDLTDKENVTEVKDDRSTFSAMRIKGIGLVGFFYTRLEDKDLTEDERLKLADTFDADLFLSLRLNSTASGRESEMNGAQVLYRASDNSGKSQEFASDLLDAMKSGLSCQDRGTIAGDEDYLVYHSRVTAAVAEPGFITNPAEREKLSDDDYQEQAAKALVRAVETYLKENR